jgi:hypothetical protein
MGVDLQQVLAHRKVGAINLPQKDKSIESEPVRFPEVVGGYDDTMVAAQKCHCQSALESNEFGPAVARVGCHCLTSEDGSSNGLALRWSGGNSPAAVARHRENDPVIVVSRCRQAGSSKKKSQASSP